jgi:hypothetical protein
LNLLAEQGDEMKIRQILVLLMFVLLGTWLAAAQDAASDSKSKSDTRTITGCLAKGDTAQDGSTWEIKSSAVSLADHVGHTVAATGVVSNATMHNLKEDTKDVAKDAHMTKSSSEHGHMKITDVQMVSSSCSK